jgi:hypothetical protein
VVDREFESRSGQIKDYKIYKIGICSISAKHITDNCTCKIKHILIRVYSSVNCRCALKLKNTNYLKSEAFWYCICRRINSYQDVFNHNNTWQVLQRTINWASYILRLALLTMILNRVCFRNKKGPSWL